MGKFSSSIILPNVVSQYVLNIEPWLGITLHVNRPCRNRLFFVYETIKALADILHNATHKGITHEESPAPVAHVGMQSVIVGKHVQPFKFDGDKPAITPRWSQHHMLEARGGRASFASDSSTRLPPRVIVVPSYTGVVSIEYTYLERIIPASPNESHGQVPMIREKLTNQRTCPYEPVSI